MGLTLTNSRSWLDRAWQVLACDGAQTLSKSHTRNPDEYPVYIQQGRGAYVQDVDGQTYIDYLGALGPILLGYAYPAVTEAVIEQVRKGTLFSLEGTLTVEVAELLTQLIPGAEKVRFVKTGSAATSAAVRVARAFTYRNIILVASNSYHGQDNYFQVTQRGRGEYGIPSNELCNIMQFEYNDLADLARAIKICRHVGEPVAAIIIEPARTFEATFEFLQGARKLCDEQGALLIYDEVVTFGRWPGLTYAAYSGVTPDLICLGKALGNGMPIGAVTGRRAVMDAFDRCFISGTYHGELSALAAAKAVLTILQSEPVVEHIWAQGEKLRAGFRGAMNRHDIPALAEGVPPCWRPTFTGPRAHELQMAFMSLCAERGILPGLLTYVGYSHKDAEALRTVQVYYQVAAELEKLLDSPPGVRP